MRETSKAMRRRWLEDQVKGHNFWDKIFTGDGIDVGCGDDPHPYCIETFDQKDGDANTLSKYFEPGSFDYIHASQLMEHLHNPYDVLRDWYRLLRPKGHIVITVPSWELYEGMRWPSQWNGDHKSTWSLWIKDSPCPKHIYVPDFIITLMGIYSCLRSELVDNNYSYKVGTSRDQTAQEEIAVEAFIEIVLRKRR